MSARHVILCTAALLLVVTPMALAATLEVSQPVQVTSSSYYERGQSVVYDGTDYWVFYGQSANVTVPYSGGDPDVHDYVVYYKKATAIADLASASASAVVGAHNADSYLGETGAAYFGSDVWVFATIDGDGLYTPAGDCDLYGWWSNDGGSTWTEVGPIITGIGDGQAHHDEVVFNGELWILEGHGDFNTMHSATPKNTASFSAPLQVPGGLTGGLGHFFVDGSNLYLALGSGSTYYIYQYDDPNTEWDLVDSKTISGYYDPTLYKVGSDYVFHCAPYTGGRQWIVGWAGSTLDGTFFDGTEVDVVEGRYGSNVWVDMWPIGFTQGGTSYLFYSSERDVPSAEGTGNIWYVEVDWDVSRDHYTYIQEAVDAAGVGDDMNVAAGTYVEQVHVSTGDIDIQGAGVDDTVVKSPASLAAYFTSGSNNNYPVVFVDGVTGIDLADMTVDGDGKGNANPRFVGVGFWNGDGSMTDMKVLNVMDTPFSGAQHGVGVYSYNDGGGPYAIAMTDVLVDDYQKTAVALLGENLTVTLTRVTTTGAGDTGVTAQNGIQTGYGSGGTITDCIITGNSYTGATWTASGLLPYDGTTLTVNGIAFDGNQTSIYWINTDGTIDGATVDNPTGDAMYAHDDGARAPHGDRPQASPFDAELGGGSRGTTTVAVSNSRFTGADVADSWGPSNYAVGDVEFTITGCDISHWDYGIAVYEAGGTATTVANGNSIHDNGTYGFWTNSLARAVQDATKNYWGDPSGPTHSTNPSGTGDAVSDNVDFDPWLDGNVVCVPDPEDLTAAVPTKTIAVNYLGGGGGLVYGYNVTFSWDDAIVSTPTGPTFAVTEGDLLSSAGTTYMFVTDTSHGVTSEITVDCALTGAGPGVTGPGTMFTVAFTGLAVGTSPINVTVVRVRDQNNQPLSGFYEDDGLLNVDVSNPTITGVAIENSTLGHTNDFIKDGDVAVVKATVLDDDPAFGASNIVADLSELGVAGPPVNPDLYDGGTGAAQWNVGAVDVANGTNVLTVRVDATDPIGNTAGQGSDTIIGDNEAPSAVTNFDAAPGHGKCDLVWTMGTDPSPGVFAGVTVRRLGEGEYPTYATFVADWPDVVTTGHYPDDELAGAEVYNGSGTSHTDSGEPRDIYFYQAFCYDEARNYGLAGATSGDFATNYWLGDVTDTWGAFGGYDGLVDPNDVERLSQQYGQAPTGDYHQCDVGPTVHPDYSRVGVPLPDDDLEFEDLMIFAMNYGVVSALVVPVLPDLDLCGSELALGLSERSVSPEGEFEVALVLSGNVAEVKGLSTEILFDTSEVEFVSARLSEGMNSPLGDMFFWHGAGESSVELDLAVLGTRVTLGGSGDVAILTFRALDDEYTLEFGKTALRGAENEVLDAELEGYESKPDLPVVFRLAGNIPNPFNPVTKVLYHVPHEAEVTIRVYDVAGRVVRTLVDGPVDPGRHQAIWDGRSDSGESVGSGVYFCTMEAGEYHGSHKMMLLK